MKSQKDQENRPLPLSMLILSNVPLLPLVETELLNKIDHRNHIIPKHERFLLWGTEIIKLATLLYALTENQWLIPATIYIVSSFVQALTINKIIDPERL